ALESVRMQFQQPCGSAFHRPADIFPGEQQIAQGPAALPTQKHGLPAGKVGKGLRDSEVPPQESAAPQLLAVLINCLPAISCVAFDQDAIRLSGRSARLWQAQFDFRDAALPGNVATYAQAGLPQVNVMSKPAFEQRRQNRG